MVLDDFLHDASSKMARLDATQPAMLLSSKYKTTGSCGRMLKMN
jgi:hypothetical protein